MKASIIIVGERKEDYLERTIISCLKQKYKNLEIILVYSKLRNLEYLRNKFQNRIFFKKINLKINNPVLDQINKIKEGVKSSNGKYIFLLDGDDAFKSNKLSKIIKINKKKLLCLDNHIVSNNKKLLYYKNKTLKKYKFYKYFFNPWPEKICTSCISGPKILFEDFFLNHKKIKTKLLAIDALLIIYYLDKLKIINDILTIKKIDKKGVDKKYSNILSKIYWERRIEQHKYLKAIYNSNYKFEYYLCLVALSFLKKIKFF